MFRSSTILCYWCFYCACTLCHILCVHDASRLILWCEMSTCCSLNCVPTAFLRKCMCGKHSTDPLCGRPLYILVKYGERAPETFTPLSLPPFRLLVFFGVLCFCTYLSIQADNMSEYANCITLLPLAF